MHRKFMRRETHTHSYTQYTKTPNVSLFDVFLFGSKERLLLWQHESEPPHTFV